MEKILNVTFCSEKKYIVFKSQVVGAITTQYPFDYNVLIVMARVPCEEDSSFRVHIFYFFLNYFIWQFSASIKYIEILNLKLFKSNFNFFFQKIYVSITFSYVQHF